MTACDNKTRREIQENKKRVKRGIHRPVVMDGGEVKKLKNVVLLRILNISGEKEKMTELQRMKELAHLSLRLGRNKALSRKRGIDPMCLRPF